MSAHLQRVLDSFSRHQNLSHLQCLNLNNFLFSSHNRKTRVQEKVGVPLSVTSPGKVPPKFLPPHFDGAAELPQWNHEVICCSVSQLMGRDPKAGRGFVGSFTSIIYRLVMIQKRACVYILVE